LAKVYFRHLRQLEYCSPRIKEWCLKHGVSLRSFRQGIDSLELRKTECPMAIKAAELAEQEVADE
jgi:hypothetical protein